MSILITGMEMPHQGEFSHVRIYDNGDVTVEVDTGKEVYEAVIAHAVQIPPHGRLIDADAPISLVDTHGRRIEVTVAHIIENNQGIVDAIIPTKEGET